MSGEAKTCESLELTRVLEQLPDGVLVLDPAAVILFINKTGARLVKLKPKAALGSVFSHAIEDGTMRDFDVEMTVKDITWQGAPAKLLHLKSLKSSGAFHLEWKLEAALERAREAEEALSALQNKPPEPIQESVDVSQYDERIAELEALLELAETRADDLQSNIALDDHEQSTALQDALSHARDAEDQVRQLEEELEESRERIRVAEEQAEVAEERAYSVELELEQVAAEKDEVTESRAELVSEIEDLRLAVTTWRESVNQLTSESEQAEAKFAELQEQLAQSQAKVTEVEQLLEQARLKHEELESERGGLFDASQESAEQSERIQQLEATNLKLQERVEQLESELGEALERDKELHQKASEFQTQIDDKQTALDELLKEVEDLRHQKTLATEESDEMAEVLRVEMEQFEERASQLEAECEETGSQLEATKTERDALASELATLKEQLEELSSSGEGFETEKAELLAKVAELGAVENECNSLRKDVRRLENLLQNAEELAQKGERVEKLERKLEGALRRAEEAEERLLEERRLLNEMKTRSGKSHNGQLESQVPGSGHPDSETERLAFQDVLTGLPNQNILHRYLGFMLKHSATHKTLTAMLRIDCDNFKTITDTFGQEFGDQLIRSVGERLSSVVRKVDVLGRYMEDEFVILLSELKDQDEATVMTASVIKRLYQKMRQPFPVGEQNIQIGVSIGVSIYPIDAQNGEQMFEHSGAALKRAKEMGRGQSQYFTPELQTRHVARNELDAQLKCGLENEQFEVLFQPIFDLTTAQVIGVESLIRWNHPDHGTLPPEKFLQVAEDSGMIVLIGNWVLRRSFQCAAEWQKHGLGIFVAVNLSRRQLLQADLVATVDSLLSEFGCFPDRVLFEVPEEFTGKDFAKVRENLFELSKLGVRLAVDNFGTSSTSLQELRRGPFAVLKIDRKFVRGVSSNEENMGIVLSALTLGHHLGRIAVAVGIESDADRQWLVQTGCRFAQGNFLSEPLLPEQLPVFMKSR